MELGGAQAPALLAMGCNMIQLLYTHSKPRQLSMSRPLHHIQLKTSISVTGQLGNRPTKNIRNFSNGTVEPQLNDIFCIFPREKCMWWDWEHNEVAWQITIKSSTVNFYEHQVLYSNFARNTPWRLNSSGLPKNRYINMAKKWVKDFCTHQTYKSNSFIHSF